MMTDPIQFAYTRHDGQVMRVIIEPVLANGENNGQYRIFKDATDDATTLFTDSNLAKQDSAPVNQNDPDYLGNISINSADNWHYTGELLTPDEQQQMAAHILQQYGFKP